MKVNAVVRDFLLDLQKKKRVTVEGNILKVMEPEEGDTEFAIYLSTALVRDKDARRKRLEITKQVQERNKELQASESENIRINEDLKIALQAAVDAKEEADQARILAETLRIESEKAKDAALTDLDIIQKRSQTELISTIVKVALGVIMSVGVITTIMYGIAMLTGKDTQIIGSTWSNMFGILLTNAFSIVGTIMGVKYAAESKSNN